MIPIIKMNFPYCMVIRLILPSCGSGPLCPGDLYHFYLWSETRWVVMTTMSFLQFNQCSINFQHRFFAIYYIFSKSLIFFQILARHKIFMSKKQNYSHFIVKSNCQCYYYFLINLRKVLKEQSITKRMGISFKTLLLLSKIKLQRNCVERLELMCRVESYNLIQTWTEIHFAALIYEISF